MIQSMTGYGRSEGRFDNYTIIVELRSLNNRYLDCTIRVPRLYLFIEEQIKSALQKAISRGKVDVYVTIEGATDVSAGISVNHAVVAHYCAAFAELAATHSLDSQVTTYQMSQLPDVLVVEKSPEKVEEVGTQILSVLQTALADFSRMREQEGTHLRNDLLNHSNAVNQLVLKIQERTPITVLEYRKKLEKRMFEMLSAVPLDENRVIAEAALFADKVAVDEELVRLLSHLAQLDVLLSEETPVGRKLDFLVQELNREANTIGSKCNDIEIAHWVVDMKAELEKIREQTQNIE